MTTSTAGPREAGRPAIPTLSHHLELIVNQTDPPAAEAEPICKFEQGCHRVVACDPGCGAAPAVFPEPPSRAAGQDEVDRLAEWLWDNCAEDERSGLLADDPRRIATVALHWPELRRVAAEEQPAETQQQEPEPCSACRYVPCETCPYLRAQQQPETEAQLASLAVNAAHALRDEKRHYEIACQENARLRTAVDVVRSLHRPASDWSWKPLGCQHDGEHSAPCRGCRGECWPCPTIRALDTQPAEPPA